MDNSDVTDFTERLLKAYKRAGGLSAIFRKTGISKSSLSNYKNGITKPTLDNLIAVARASEVAVGWLANGEGKMEDGIEYAQLSGSDEGLDELNKNEKGRLIKEIDVSLSAGNGALVEREDVVGSYTFYDPWLDDNPNIRDKNQLVIVRVSGDSMDPTVSSNDKVMVDLSQTTMYGNGMYAIALDNNVLIKRLERTLESIEVVSDNKIYKPFTVTNEQLENLRIIGRVVWVGRNV